jgi:AcrR family transcriptional regulator
MFPLHLFLYCAVHYTPACRRQAIFVLFNLQTARVGVMRSTNQKRGRGRPRSFDLDDALDRAVEVFWKNGYEGADMTALTDAMGINRPSLYVAYKDKRTLFFKAVERYYQTIAKIPLPTAVDGKRCPDLSPIGAAILNLFYGSKQPRGCLIACVLADQANGHEDAKKVLKKIIMLEERRLEQWAGQFLSGEHAISRGQSFASLLIAILHSTAIKASAGVPEQQMRRELTASMMVLSTILGS